DREIALHGRETGVIEFSPEGAILERHELVDQYRLYELVAFESRQPVPAQPNKKGKVGTWEKFRAFWSRRFYEDRVEPISSKELSEAHNENDQQSRKLQGSASTAVCVRMEKRDHS